MKRHIRLDEELVEVSWIHAWVSLVGWSVVVRGQLLMVLCLMKQFQSSLLDTCLVTT